MKGTRNLISFEEKPDLVREFPLSISGKGSTEIVHTIRLKEPFLKNNKQEFGSFLVHQIRECTPAPLWLHSGNQPILLSQLYFYNWEPQANLSPFTLEPGWGKGISIMWKAHQMCSPSRDRRLGMTRPCLHSRGKQHRVVCANRAEWLSKKLQKTRDCKQHGCFVHSPPYADSIPDATWLREPPLPLSHINLSYHDSKDTNVIPLPLWVMGGAGSLLWLKGIPKVFSVEEGSDLAWEVLLCNIGEYQHIASSYDQGKMDFTQMSQTRVWKCHVCRGYSTQWSDTSPNAYCSGNQPLPFP